MEVIILKKTVFIDTNILNSDGSYYLDKVLVNGRGLKAGDEVIAYQEGEEWDAKIIFINDSWGVEINSPARTISMEKQTGYNEGFWEGYYCQLLNISKVFEQLNISRDKLDSLFRYMNDAK